jgi:hypothetical protein
MLEAVDHESRGVHIYGATVPRRLPG